MRKYELNENCFKKITPEMSYWLGFITADGNIRLNNHGTPTINICLHSKDIGHIEKFKNFCGSTHPIWTNSKTPASHVRWSSRIMFDDLQRWGMKERKTYSITSHIKYIPDEYKHYFIVGLFDGDGSFIIRDKKVKDKKYNRTYTYTQCTISLISNQATLEDMCEFLSKQGMKYPKITKIGKGFVYNCRWYSKSDINKFYQIYKQSPIHLDRKLYKIDDYTINRGSCQQPYILL